MLLDRDVEEPSHRCDKLTVIFEITGVPGSAGLTWRCMDEAGLEAHLRSPLYTYLSLVYHLGSTGIDIESVSYTS